MLALTTDGQITQCRAKTLGNGRCNHVLHQKEDESPIDFINNVNASTKSFSIGQSRRPLNNPKTIDEKKALSGRFNNCIFVNNADIEKLSEKLFEQRETSHNKLDNEYRNDKIFEYEKEFSGKVQDMFIVDRGHRDGNELHVVKNNGIVEIFNIQKLRNEENSLITKLIARPSQIRRYYT